MAPRPNPVQTSAYVVQASNTLFQGTQTVVIQHAGETYRLRITRQNKLILTK